MMIVYKNSLTLNFFRAKQFKTNKFLNQHSLWNRWEHSFNTTSAQC